MENNSPKPDNLTIVHIGVMILTIIACTCFINMLIASAKGYYIDTHANYTQEYATIVRYEAVHRRYQGYCYTTYYEYQADGMIYSGICQRNIQDEKEAKAQVGKKVRIYVDHTSKHHTRELASAVPIWIAGTLSLVCFIFFFELIC